MNNRTLLAKTVAAGYAYYPAYFNLSEEGGKVILRVRADERKPPHPAPDYPLSGQDVAFELDMDEVMQLYRELVGVVSRFATLEP